MNDDELLALMVKVDPMTRRIPAGIRAIAQAIEAAERERCAKLVEAFPRLVDENGDWGARGDSYPQEHAVLAAAIRGPNDQGEAPTTAPRKDRDATE